MGQAAGGTGESREKTVYRVLVLDQILDVTVWGIHNYYAINSLITIPVNIRVWSNRQGVPCFGLTANSEVSLPVLAA